MPRKSDKATTTKDKAEESATVESKPVEEVVETPPTLTTVQSLLDKYLSTMGSNKLLTPESKIEATCALFRLILYIDSLPKENKSIASKMISSSLDLKSLKKLDNLSFKHDMSVLSEEDRVRLEKLLLKMPS